MKKFIKGFKNIFGCFFPVNWEYIGEFCGLIVLLTIPMAVMAAIYYIFTR